MGITTSSYYDLIRVRELGPESKDWATTDKNFEILSLLIKAFEQHVHTGSHGLAAPSLYPTVTIAGPAVFNTSTNHNLVVDQAFTLGTTGTLPTGLAVGATYYVLASGLTSSSFQASTTAGGSPIATSGSQSGQIVMSMQPTLTESTTGGSLAPGTTVGVRLSYTNAQGLETNATTERDITLAPAASKPLTPQLVTTSPELNCLSGGTYMYVITKIKGAGETTPSDALAVTVPYDQTYAVTISFDPINTYTDGTTQLNIYRSAGLNSSFQLIEQVTDADPSQAFYTDTNVSVDQTAQPPSVSTFDNVKTVHIDWSSLTHPLGATFLNVYVTQQPGIWSTTHLLTSIPLASSPPTSMNYLGSENLSTGYPYDFTQIPNQPPPIDASQLDSSVGGTGGTGSTTSGGIPPIGACIPYTGNGDPGGGQWVVADGRLIDKLSYASFFSITGHTYNGGIDPGANLVRIPDKRGKKSVGAINMGSAAGAGPNDNAHLQVSRGVGGGEVNHTLTLTETAAHNHGGATSTTMSANDPHDHTVLGGLTAGGAGYVLVGTTANDFNITTSLKGLEHSHTISSAGSGATHNNADPYQADSYIVRIL